MDEYYPERIPDEGVDTYTKIAEYAGMEFYRNVARDIAKLNPKILLDIGTGPGILLAEILKLVNCFCIGIDCTEKFKNYVKYYTNGKAEFLVADAYFLPFDNCVFDVVVSTGVLHDLKFPERFFEEIYRVLKNGGYALIKDPTPLRLSLEEARRFLSDEEFEIFKAHKDFELKVFGTDIPWTFSEEEVKLILRNSNTNFEYLEIKKEKGVLTLLLKKI